MKTLQTERLTLRKAVATDAPFFYELFNSEGWLKYIGDRNIKTVKDAETQILEKYIPSYEVNGYGSYVVLESDTNKAIGACGLYKRDNLDHADIGFAFLPEVVGKGYGYESAKAVLDYATGALEMTKILAFTVSYNLPSIALLKKIGLVENGTYTFEDDSEELLLFTTP